MIRSLFVNLPVADLPRTVAFFSALGFGFNERYTNEQAACLVVNEHISCMLLQQPFFQGFTKLPVADAQAATEVLLALQVDSRAEVDALVAKARAAGGTVPNDLQDMGFMVQHGFADPDGHQWEVFYMDEAAAPAQF
jgi:predicted lactoylglutathione lyase